MKHGRSALCGYVPGLRYLVVTMGPATVIIRSGNGTPQRIDDLGVQRDFRRELVKETVVAQLQVEGIEQPPLVLLREVEQVELGDRHPVEQCRVATARSLLAIADLAEFGRLGSLSFATSAKRCWSRPRHWLSRGSSCGVGLVTPIRNGAVNQLRQSEQIRGRPRRERRGCRAGRLADRVARD